MTITKLSTSIPLVLLGQQTGVTIIPAQTPLTRLNYFDGKFLRAQDLQAEQDYLRQLVQLSNRANGFGIVNGFDVQVSGGDQLNLSAGLAIDPHGRVLLLSQEQTVSIQELLDKSRNLTKLLQSSTLKAIGGFADCTSVSEAPTSNAAAGRDWYLLVLAHAEALCGEEDVYGKLCDEACVTSTDRPNRVEGVVLRALPLMLSTPLATSSAVSLTRTHLQSLLASAYYSDEAKRLGSLISGAGLQSEAWCRGAMGLTGNEVPVGILVRDGSTTLFVDEWIARRELLERSPHRYWQWCMAMRPWDVFLAQILQFQCQLSDLFKKQPQASGGDDPYASTHGVIREASDTIAKIADFYQTVTTRFTLRPPLAEDNAKAEEPPVLKGGLSALLDFHKRLQTISAATLIPSNKILIDGGIIELPSAGYLPVIPSSVVSVNEQVRRLLGKGVELRFCIVRPDFVAHALEEAQHMERISLLEGLDDPKNKPKVDILVPGGLILQQKLLSSGLGFEAILDVNPSLFYEKALNVQAANAEIVNRNIRFEGAARAEKLASGGGAVYLGAEFELAPGLIPYIKASDGASKSRPDANKTPITEMFTSVRLGAARVSNPRMGAWISLRFERNIFELKPGDKSNFNARAIVAATPQTLLLDVDFNGTLEITRGMTATGGAKTFEGRIQHAPFTFVGRALGNPGPSPTTILVNLDATVTLTSNAAIDIVLTNNDFHLKMSANWDKQPMEVKAAITVAGEEITFAVAAELKENAEVLSADNINHRQALDALDIFAAVLGDVNFVAANSRLLFPPPPALTDEIVIRAISDWVLFHRRRDKQCSAIIETPEVKPPQSYRVFNITVPSEKRAKVIAKQLEEQDGLATRLKDLSNSPIDLVIKFEGDSAQPRFNIAVVEKEWSRLKPKPGKTIAYVFFGAKGDNNQTLQTNRLRQFESAISQDSKENESTILKPLAPVPEQALPSDADGIMLFITIANLRKALLVYCGLDTVREEPVPRHFLHSKSPFGTMQFDGNTAQGNELRKFIKANQPVLGVTLATTKAEPDADASERLEVVTGALGGTTSALARKMVERLSEHDSEQITQRIEQDWDSFDEIIFFESNVIKR